MKPYSIVIAVLLTATGCGTSKWTDTGRSATEQLLITDAMDRAVSDLDFRALAGKTAYIESTALKKITDSEYLVSCMRQHMLASGCIVKDTKTEADYIVEVRAGAVGTDRHDVLYGVPAVNIPTVVPVTGIPSHIPEMPVIKKTDQRAVVKLSLFAYNQKTGRPLWQSGAVPQESDAKAVWVLGAGPFHRGTIFDGMEFAGDKLNIPLIDVHEPTSESVSVADEAYFTEPEEKTETAVAALDEKKDAAPKPPAESKKPASVMAAGHSEPAAKAKPTAAAAAPPLPPALPSVAPPSPALPPAAPAEAAVSESPAVTIDSPATTPPVTAKQPPRYPPNDLAPALFEFPFHNDAKPLQKPSGGDSAAASSPPPESSTPPASTPLIPE